MKTIATIIAAGLAIAAAGSAAARPDNEAGAPLSAGEAVGAWTLESGGKSLCVMNLGADRAGRQSFTAQVPADCAGYLPVGVAGWTPAVDGMALVNARGQSLIAFHRWSNSLFVSHRSSGEDVQLKRGGPAS